MHVILVARWCPLVLVDQHRLTRKGTAADVPDGAKVAGAIVGTMLWLVVASAAWAVPPVTYPMSTRGELRLSVFHTFFERNNADVCFDFVSSGVYIEGAGVSGFLSARGVKYGDHAITDYVFDLMAYGGDAFAVGVTIIGSSSTNAYLWVPLPSSTSPPLPMPSGVASGQDAIVIDVTTSKNKMDCMCCYKSGREPEDPACVCGIACDWDPTCGNCEEGECYVCLTSYDPFTKAVDKCPGTSWQWTDTKLIDTLASGDHL